MYYPHWCVGNASLAVDTPKPDNSSGTTSASDDADGLPVNTAGTSAASQGAHLNVNICDTCGLCGYSGVVAYKDILTSLYLTT